MPRPNIRPWRDHAELLSVRRLLYHETETTNHETHPESQRLGVNIVNTWKRRCHVPHSIYSTAVLVDAQLHHNVEKNSTFAIRAVYSTAFARFVTGFCDIGQNSAVKRSMYEMAEAIGMPETWVELRHEITHGQVPDLRILEYSVKAALSWLWDIFWVKLDAPAEDVSGAQANLRAILRSFASNRRDDIKLRKNPDPEIFAATTRKLLRFCKNKEDSSQLLVSVLLEEKIMLPSQTQSKLNMKPAFLIWDKLLQTIAANRQSFQSVLVESLLKGIIHVSPIDMDDDHEKSALFQWLLHLVTTSSWHTARFSLDDLRTTIMETSLLTPGFWSNKLASAVLRLSDSDFKELWEPLIEVSLFDCQDSTDDIPPSSDGASSRNSTPEMRTQVGDQSFGNASHAFDEANSTLRSHPLSLKTKKEVVSPKKASGWKLWEGGWIPKPIGVAHTYQTEE